MKAAITFWHNIMGNAGFRLWVRGVEVKVPRAGVHMSVSGRHIGVDLHNCGIPNTTTTPGNTPAPRCLQPLPADHAHTVRPRSRARAQARLGGRDRTRASSSHAIELRHLCVALTVPLSGVGRDSASASRAMAMPTGTAALALALILAAAVHSAAAACVLEGGLVGHNRNKAIFIF